MSAAVGPALLAASLLWWPFGGDEKKNEEAPAEVPVEGTIGSLQGKQATIPPSAPVTDAEARARQNYRLYLEMGANDPERGAEALRRLADLELEAGEAATLQTNADTLQASSYATATELYARMLRDYPDHPRNDLVYYQLARAQESGGDPVTALATLDILVSRYPNTPMMDEVQFRRGELLFSFSRWRDAEQAYLGVLALSKESPFREAARYKHGWTLFKQGAYDGALESFLLLLDGRMAGIDEADVDAWMNSTPRALRETLDDTLRVSSLSLSYLDAERTLSSVMAAMGQPSYRHVLYVALANLYLEQQRYNDAATVLTSFVEANLSHPRSPYLMRDAIAALETGGFPSEVLVARERYVQHFGFEQPYWQRQKREDHPEVVAYLRDSIWVLSQHAHASLQALPAKAGAERAALALQTADWYRRMIRYFPDDPRAPESHFLLSEVLYESGDDIGAVEAFEATAYSYANHPRAAEAGYASLLAYQRRLASLTNPVDKAAWNRRGLDARIRFAQTFPTHPNAVLARVDAAEGLFAVSDFPAAIGAAEGVVDNPAATPAQRRVAWQVIGHSRFDQQQWAPAEAAYLQVRALDAAAGKTDAELTERLAASIYRQGEQARAAGDAQTASGHFARVAGVAPGSKIRVTADYDAAMTLMQAGQAQAAIPLMESFRRTHGSSELGEQVTASLATAYLQTGNDTAAAAEFERIAAAPTSTPQVQQEALLKAVELHKKRGDASAEARILERFVQQFPGEFNDALEAQQRLYELAHARGDTATSTRWAQKLIAFDAAAGAQRSDRSRYLAARAALAMAQPVRNAFDAVTLKAPLNQTLKLKRTRMEAALAAYAKAADYGVAEVLTEATFQTAAMYSGLAASLLDSERPRNLDEVALEEYQVLLEEQAFPLEEKAIEIHEANARRAADGVYDDWVRKSYTELARLLPARWGKTEIGGDHVDAIR